MNSTINKITPAEIAKAIVAKAKEYGFSVKAGGTVVTVHKTFTPGDKQAYCNAESDANTILGMIRRTEPGSTWGTDGASIGGHIGLTNGYMTLNKSGCSKQIVKELAKLR
jgi:hypothetical protein